MAEFIVLANETTKPEAAKLFLTVFDQTSVDSRLGILSRAGVVDSHASRIRALGLNSLARATAAEVGLHALATVRDKQKLGIADAVIAALRVARGMSEDRRSVNDPFIGELIRAAENLLKENSASEALTELPAICRTWHEWLRAGGFGPSAYLEGMRSQSYAIAGALLYEHGLVSSAMATDVRDFAMSLAVLSQISEDARALSHPVRPATRNSTVLTDVKAMWESESDRGLLLDAVANNCRILLRATKSVQGAYSSHPLLDEVLVRANITLGRCVDLLKQETGR